MIARICKLIKMQPPVVAAAGLLFASGATVPADGTKGFQTGCVFQKTNGAVGTAMYINEGTSSNCDFNANATSAAESLTGLSDVGAALAYTAGKILVADGVDYEEVAVSGDATLAASGALTVPLLSATAGTATASKAAKLDVNKAIDAVRTASLLLGVSGSEVAVSATAAELNYCDVATPGTVEASKAVVVDASKNASAFAALGCVDLDAGSSGAAGTIDVFPETADNGKLVISCAAVGASGRTGTLRLHSLTQTTTFHISDPGAKAEVYLVASSAAMTPAEVDVLSGVTPGTVAASKAVTVDANKTVRFGGFNTGGAPTDAIALTTAFDKYTDGQLDVLSVFVASTTDLTSAYSAKAGRFRHLVVGTSLQVNHETYGLVGQLVGKSASLLHMHSGLMGTLEANTTALVANGAYAYSVAAVIARVGGGALLTATKPVAGFAAILNGVNMASGDSAAFAACGTSTGTWTHLLAADKCDNVFYAATGTAYESGVKIASITALGTTASGCLRVKVADTLYYIPLYAAAELTGE